MLHLFRRHYPPCPYTSRRYRRCNCPVWVQGSLRGEWIKKSLNLTSWEAASDLITGWTASGEIGVLKPEAPSIQEVVEKFFEDARARELSSATISKLRVLLEKQLVPWCEHKGYRRLKQLGTDEVTQFRATWNDAAISKYKKQERLKSFFKFCIRRKWMLDNPVDGLKPVKVSQIPTMPFSEEEMNALLEACDRYPIQGIYNSGNRTRLRAMILLLRYSGLRIRDAATLERDRIKNGKLFLYTAKTGTPVWLPLPPDVLKALNEVRSPNPKYWFWSGNGDPKTTVADWQRSFRKLCELAEVDGHFHMFRDSFAISLLEKGVPIEDVAVLLGHQNSRVTARHYNPWIKSRQDQLEAAVKKAW